MFMDSDLIRPAPFLERIPLVPSNFGQLKRALESAGLASDSYLECPAFYLLAGRRGGYLLLGEQSAIAVCRHPHRNDTLIVMPEIGASHGEFRLAASAIRFHSQDSEQNVMLGKWAMSDSKKLADRCEFELSPVLDPTMDWRYPTHVHSTAIVSEMKGSKFAKVRNKVRIAQRAGVTARFLEKVHPQQIGKAVEGWSHGRAQAPSKSGDGYYAALGTLVAETPNEFLGMEALDKRGFTVGIAVWRLLDHDTANIYAHICSRSVSGLSDFLLHEVCSALAHNGVEFANVGGSEDPSLDGFKRKFQPVKSILQHSFRVTRDKLARPHQLEEMVMPNRNRGSK